MNVLVLMAGPSDSLREAGYQFPKPLIEIGSKPVVQHALERLLPLLGAGDRLIVMLRQDENLKYHIGAVVKLLAPAAEVFEVRGETSGAACTALLAVDRIDADEPLVVLNGDQIIEADLAPIVRSFQDRALDGGIIVFNDVHPRWSFVKCDADGLVIETAEKRPISNIATAGFYYFRSGKEFVQAAETMILKDAAVDGRFFVCPAYNELILRNQKVGVHFIKKDQYISLATAKRIEVFEHHIKEPHP